MRNTLFYQPLEFNALLVNHDIKHSQLFCLLIQQEMFVQCHDATSAY